MTESEFLSLPYRLAVDAIIKNEKGEILLVQKSIYQDTDWAFAGGGIDENETAEAALEREINEELGIQSFKLITKSKVINKYDFRYEDVKPDKPNKYRGQIKTVFLVEISSESPITLQEDEIRRYIWVTPQKALEMFTFPNQKELSLEIFKDLNLI